MPRTEPFRFVQRATPYTRKRTRLLNGRRYPDPYMQVRPRFRLGDWLDTQLTRTEVALGLACALMIAWGLSGVMPS